MHDIHTLTQEAATHLDGFTYAELGGNARLVHQDGRTILIRPARGAAGRVKVSGCYPREAALHLVTENHEITMTAERGGQALASEISRRLLPGYTKEYEYVLRRLDALARVTQRRIDHASHLATRLPQSRVQEGQNGFHTVHFHGESGSYGTVELSGSTSARWTFTTDNAELSLHIAAIIREFTS